MLFRTITLKQSGFCTIYYFKILVSKPKYKSNLKNRESQKKKEKKSQFSYNLYDVYVVFCYEILSFYQDFKSENLCFFRVIRNRKIVWKNGKFYLSLNLKYLGWSYKEYIKTAKNGGFCEELLSKNDFEAVLATFFCCGYSANGSKAVQKIASDQKGYHKCSLCVTICWTAKIYQLIRVRKGWLITY